MLLARLRRPLFGLFRRLFRCLRTQRGIATTFDAVTVDTTTWQQVTTWALPGIPSRTRVSDDGTLVGTTAFVTGHSYATVGFSTQTEIHRVDGTSLGNIEDWLVVVDGAPLTAVDRNLWGVTFVDDDTFYATAASQSAGKTWLVRGSIGDRTMIAQREGAECPAVSPDRTHVAYKKVVDSRGAQTVWALAVLDLASGTETLLPATEGLDDQPEWLDDDTLLYGLPRTDEPGTTDVWSVDVAADSTPAVLVPEGAPGYGELTVREFLHFIVRVRGLKADVAYRRIDETVHRLQLEDVLEQCIDTLSKGLRRRVGLAQAILHDPPVLMLDEPTDGLDPNQKHAVRQLIDAMARERTILISTHLLEEVHALCNRVVILARGTLLADATPAELEARSRYHGAVSFSAPGSGVSQEMLGRLPQVASIEVDPLDGRITVFPKPGMRILEPVQTLLREQGLEVSEIQLERGRLDEVFRQITTADAA